MREDLIDLNDPRILNTRVSCPSGTRGALTLGSLLPRAIPLRSYQDTITFRGQKQTAKVTVYAPVEPKAPFPFGHAHPPSEILHHRPVKKKKQKIGCIVVLTP